MRYAFIALGAFTLLMFSQQIFFQNNEGISKLMTNGITNGLDFITDPSHLDFLTSEPSQIYLNDVRTNYLNDQYLDFELEYFGKWQKANVSIANFTQPEGDSRFIINSRNHAILISLLDGIYVDQRQFLINIDVPTINSTMKVFTNKSASIKTTLREGFSTVDTQNGLAEFNLTLIEIKGGGINNRSEMVNATLTLNSTKLGLNITVTFSTSNEKLQSRAMNYSILVTLLCCGHLYACVQLIKHFAENPGEANKISLLTIGFLTCWDLLLSLFHLYGALTKNQYFHFFITPSFWYFILASIFETRLLLLIWRIRYLDNITNQLDLRRGLFIFYMKFYGGLIATTLLANFFLYQPWFLFACSGFFVPQIIHSAIQGQRFKPQSYYLFGLGVLRGVIPLYVKGCPANVFAISPSLIFCIALTASLLLQTLILHLQGRFGSRFFVPRCFLPPKYNYYIKESTDQTMTEDADCAICMEGLHHEAEDKEAPLLHKKTSSSKYVVLMQTPCRHKFHSKCLVNWMNIKLECPLCKSPIPSLE